MTTPNMTDPFADPATPPSTYPSIESFRGRLVMITPRRIDEVADFQNKTKMIERITADVSVVDGLGPVPVFKNRSHTGQTLEGPDFTGVYFNHTFVREQLRPFIGTGRAVLGIIDTKTPGTLAGQGNPWGIIAATDAQKAQARAYLANRSVAQAASPAPAPVQAAPQYATAPTVAPQPGPAAVAPTAPPAVPAPGSAAPGSNPFL